MTFEFLWYIPYSFRFFQPRGGILLGVSQQVQD